MPPPPRAVTTRERRTTPAQRRAAKDPARPRPQCSSHSSLPSDRRCLCVSALDRLPCHSTQWTHRAGHFPYPPVTTRRRRMGHMSRHASVRLGSWNAWRIATRADAHMNVQTHLRFRLILALALLALALGLGKKTYSYDSHHQMRHGMRRYTSTVLYWDPTAVQYVYDACHRHVHAQTSLLHRGAAERASKQASSIRSDFMCAKTVASCTTIVRQ